MLAFVRCVRGMTMAGLPVYVETRTGHDVDVSGTHWQSSRRAGCVETPGRGTTLCLYMGVRPNQGGAGSAGRPRSFLGQRTGSLLRTSIFWAKPTVWPMMPTSDTHYKLSVSDTGMLETGVLGQYKGKVEP